MKMIFLCQHFPVRREIEQGVIRAEVLEEHFAS